MMRIHIIRGQNQIGGSIVELSSGNTRIVLDVGSQLDEQAPVAPQVEGLFQGKPGYDAVFITHYHGDHVGLLPSILPGIPVYMGEKAFAVYKAASEYANKKSDFVTGFLSSGKKILIGDFVIQPFLCDHSAFDAYMLLITCKGKRVLYTGDFRASGRKSYSALLRRLVKVDVQPKGRPYQGSPVSAKPRRI